MDRIKEFVGVVRHKMAFMRVRASNSYLYANISLWRALMHDTAKAVNILVLGDNLATSLHRAFAGHHREDGMTHAQKVEAFCDWECARITKPNKPLNGEETWMSYYRHVDMSEIVHNFKKS